MARFRKDVLVPGTYALADGRRVTYTPDDVAGMARRARDMIAAGLSIPICWDHQDVGITTDAERLARKAKATLGWVEGADVGPDGALSMTLEVPDEDDARRLPAIRFVSPEIDRDVSDGAGRTWPGRSITHVAVTPRPVQAKQNTFARLGRTEGSKREKPVRLSLGDLTMADDKVDDAVPDGTGGGELGDLIEALRAAGMTIPDEVVDIPGLIIAIKAGGDAAAADVPPAEDVTEDVTGEGGAAEEVPTPMMLSLQSRVTDLEREKLIARIDALGVPVKVKSDLRRRAGSEKLGLGKDAGLASCALTIEVEAYERLGANAFTGGRDVAKAREVPHPHTDPEDLKREAAERAGRYSKGGKK
jgi:hypothetical protein